MKTEMSEDGVITIRPESSVDVCALEMLAGNSAISTAEWVEIEAMINSPWPQEDAS